MFQRRLNPTFFQRAREFMWPRAGWLRSSRYLLHRIRRLPGTPYAVAGGFACGAAASFTPFVGLHFVLAALFAWGLRCSILASAIGTALGNPWTFPFIWVWIYNLGAWMGAGEATESAETMDFGAQFAAMMAAFLRADFAYLWDIAWPIFWPMLAGGIPTAIVVWFVFYIPMKEAIAAYQHRRRRRRAPRQTRGELETEQ